MTIVLNKNSPILYLFEETCKHELVFELILVLDYRQFFEYLDLNLKYDQYRVDENLNYERKHIFYDENRQFFLTTLL